jgi:thiol-disulfide isomerase/thioredoxin
MVLELRIGSDNDGEAMNSNISKLKQSYSSGKPIFMLIRKDGCPPCEETKPEWLKIVHSEDVKPLDIVVADVEEQTLNALSFMKPSVNVVGFPTMVHVHKKKIHPFEEGRDVNAFVNWIKSTVKKSTFKKGGAKSRSKSTFKKGGAKSKKRSKSRARSKKRRRVKY